jgi:hypothetical protein
MVDKSFEEWMVGKPDHVKEFFLEFPPGTVFVDPEGSRMWVLGCSEIANSKDLLVIATPVDPGVDYDEAHRKKMLCQLSEIRRCMIPPNRTKH